MNFRKLGKNQVTLEGVLNPIDWDSEGSPTQFSIYSDDEEDYIIKNYPKPKKLKKLLSKRVRAQGRQGINSYGEKVIYTTRLQEMKRNLPTNTPKTKQSFLLDEFPIKFSSNYLEVG